MWPHPAEAHSISHVTVYCVLLLFLFLINICWIVFIADKTVILYKSFYFLLIRGFSGLGVACWPLVPKFTVSNPAETVRFLKAKKFLNMPSFGGEVKPSVPCLRSAVSKRSLNGVEVIIGQSNALHHKDHHVHLLHVLLPQHRDWSSEF